MAVALVVTQPFAAYIKGDRITHPSEVQSTLASQPHRVVRIEAPNLPAPPPPPVPKAAPEASEAPKPRT